MRPDVFGCQHIRRSSTRLLEPIAAACEPLTLCFRERGESDPHADGPARRVLLE
jgi:hypothetical protein